MADLTLPTLNHRDTDNRNGRAVDPAFLLFYCEDRPIRVVAGHDRTVHVSLVDVIIVLDHIRARLPGTSPYFRPGESLCGKAHDGAFPLFTPADTVIMAARDYAGTAGEAFSDWYNDTVRPVTAVLVPVEPRTRTNADAVDLTAAEEDAMIERAMQILRARVASMRR